MQNNVDKRLERVKSYIAIQNLMSKYQYLYAAGMMSECVDLFARRDDSLVHVSWGYYTGWKKINRLFTQHLAKVNAPALGPGVMYEHPLMTPYIEVAGDGETAKGVWWSQGHEAGPSPLEKGAPIHAYWNYLKYACDFIKERGQWKIWHQVIIGIFLTDYKNGWVDDHLSAEGLEWSRQPDVQPDGPPYIGDNSYSRRKIYRRYLPAAPEPYETFDTKTGIRWCDSKTSPRPIPDSYKGISHKV